MKTDYTNPNYFLIRSMLVYTTFGFQGTSSAQTISMLLLQSLGYMYYGPFIPHLIISVRELYDRELHGRLQGIDTGFGVLSQPTPSVNVVVSAIVFADGTPEQDLAAAGDADDSESEAIQLEVIGGDVYQV